MGRLTTHVLDTASGKPGSSIRFELVRLAANNSREAYSFVTNADGRCDQPLLQDETFKMGTYELIFHVAEYFRRQQLLLPDPPFLDQVVIRFGIADAAQHYHVPLLISPWSYSTYRGS